MNPGDFLGALVGIVALLVPVFIFRSYYRYKEKELGHSRQPALPPPDDTTQKRLESVENQKKLLEERVRNLESIVCSVDLELNARLVQLSQVRSSKVQAGQLPADATRASTVAVAGPVPLAPGRVL